MKQLALMAVALMGCAEKQLPPASRPAPPSAAQNGQGVAPKPGVSLMPPNPLPDGSLDGSFDSCGVGRVGNMVGKAVTATMEDDARKRSGARAVRMVRPGAMVTMDFRPDRLNIHVDDKGVVTRLRCG